MITVIELETRAKTPTPEGSARTVLSAATDGTKVEVTVRDVDAGKACQLTPSARTQVAYVLDGSGATVSYSGAHGGAEQPLGRRSGVYLEPGESATISAKGSPLSLLLVTVPKHVGKAVGPTPPAGYLFEEVKLRSLVDEKRFRERTFWVNKETGLSGSWDLQLGRMLYAPQAHSPRHVHHASKTSPVTPEHFYFIEKGTGEVKHDSGTVPVRPGSLILIPAGDWHQLIASDSGLDYIEFQAPFDFVTTMDHDPLGKNWYIKGTDDGTGKPILWVQS
jgi:mannose-6-phosphate isomerase-like protein (cupin superfamily)